jgi:hypothetical protein
MMTLTPIRCPSCNGKSIEAQRTYTMQCGAPRTLYHCAPCGTVFFRNPPYPHCPVENAHCPRGASPCRPHRRGRAQRCDTAVRGEQK